MKHDTRRTGEAVDNEITVLLLYPRNVDECALRGRRSVILFVACCSTTVNYYNSSLCSGVVLRIDTILFLIFINKLNLF